MPDEIKVQMKTVLETIVVRTDEDRRELYNALDRLCQEGSLLVMLHQVSKATGIPYLTLSNLDFETQQAVVFEYLSDSSSTKQIYMLTNNALAVIELAKVAKLIGVPVKDPDYYKELPRNDRHVESMTEAQAVAVMSALTTAGVEFSAAKRGDDKVGITVSKKDLVALNDIMYQSIGKIAHTQAAKENAGKGEKGKYQTINPEYYASLDKEQRFSRVEAKDTAREIVKGLMAAKIPYSAVVRKNDTVAITVSKENAQAYATVDEAVKAGKDYLSDGYLGFAVFNNETKEIEHTEGDFPLTRAFNAEILAQNSIIEPEDRRRVAYDLKFVQC